MRFCWLTRWAGGLFVLLLLATGCSAAGQELNGAPTTGAPFPTLTALNGDGDLLGKLAAPTVTPMSAHPDLAGIVSGMRGVLATRPGVFTQTEAVVLDNERLARASTTPNYGQMLAQWGRQTGYSASFERTGDIGDGRLLHAGAIISRYATPAGAHDAYQYVLGQYTNQAWQAYTVSQADGRALPWDEAIVFYKESQTEQYRLGSYTLIFRTSRTIGFISNVGLVGAVSTHDTADLTQAVMERLRDGATAQGRVATSRAES